MTRRGVLEVAIGFVLALVWFGFNPLDAAWGIGGVVSILPVSHVFVSIRLTRRGVLEEEMSTVRVVIVESFNPLDAAWGIGGGS